MSLKSVFFSFLMLLCFASFAQQDVYFKVNHRFGTDSFAYWTVHTSYSLSGPSDYQIFRLEYYISEIEIIHDGGQRTSIDDKYIIVDPTQQLNELLGTFSFTSIDSIKFSIGVDSSANHDDPATYAMDHPLAPRFPAMHWGWTAGYRFTAIDGYTGSNINEIFSVHSLGDQNYFSQTHAATLDTINGDIFIELDADYEKALRNVYVDRDLVFHGITGYSLDVLENFRDFVFSSNLVGIEAQKKENEFNLYPNPSSGQVFVKTKNRIQSLNFELIDITGRIVENGTTSADEYMDFKSVDKGMYLLKLYEGNSLLGSEKLILN